MTVRSIRRRSLGLLMLAAVTAGAGCHSSLTEIVVVVDSPLPVPSALDAVLLRVTGTDGSQREVTTPLAGPSARTLPVTLGLVPSGDALGPITVEAIGQRQGANVVRAAARVSFVRGQERLLELVLDPACVGVPCTNEQTCAGGTCGGIDVGSLPPFVGQIPALDAGGGSHDAGPPDAGFHDAGYDAGYHGYDAGFWDAGFWDAGFGDAGACTSHYIPYAVDVECDVSTWSCVDSCYDSTCGCYDDSCLFDCFYNDPLPNCDACANDMLFACNNQAGCQSEWDCLGTCADPYGCQDDACFSMYCPAQDNAYWNCVNAEPPSTCAYAWAMCMPPHP